MLRSIYVFIFIASLSAASISMAQSYTFTSEHLLEQAKQRIEKIRKTDLTIVLKDPDAQGKPVEITMLAHDFHFGSAIAAQPFLNNERYREEFFKSFNYATISNSLKWPHFIKPVVKERAMKVAELLKDRNVPLRGHTLVWNFPSQYKELTPDRQYNLLMEFIRDVVGSLTVSGAIMDWDVQNEASHHSNVFKAFGRDSLANIYRLVHQMNPNARLIINDAKILSQADKIYTNGHEDFHFQLVSDLVAAGAPVHGIGFQGHHSNRHLVPLDTVWRILERFSAFNLPLQITEMDIKVAGGYEAVLETREQERLEAAYLHDFMTLCFSHPLMDAIIMWGFWDGMHWKKNAPLYYDDWTLKPSGKMYKDLVLKEWMTHEKGQIDKAGKFSTRLFKGTYSVKVGDWQKDLLIRKPMTIEIENGEIKIQ